MNNLTDLEQIEISIDDAHRKIKLMKSLQQLIKNKDFNAVIDTGYFEEEAVRLVHLKADPNMQEHEQQEGVLRAIDSIGYLRTYLSLITRKGEAAKEALANHEQTREDILHEDLEGVA